MIFTEEFLEQVKELFDLGFDRDQIAEKLNVSGHKARKACEHLGLKAKTGRKSFIYKNDSKKCVGCGEILALDKFGTKIKSGKPRPKSNCRACEAKKQKERRAKKVKPNKRQKFNYTEEFLQDVQKLFDDGYGTILIARKLNVKEGNIVIAYKRLGLRNSEKTKGKTNIRKTHLYTEYYCRECKKILPISEFRVYKNKKGLTKIKSLCLIHEREEGVKLAKIYAKNNKDKVKNVRQRRYHRKKHELSFKFRKIFSRQIARALKKQGKIKTDSYLKFLPYTLVEMIAHLKSKFEWWMTENNHGIYDPKIWDDNDSSTWKWQVDHIIPQSDLPYTSMEDENFKKCWALENLRPLSAKQNCFDGASRVRHRLEKKKAK